MATLRNSKDIIKGSHLMVFMEDGNGDLQPIAFATSHSFSKQLNTQEISCKDFGDVAAVLPQNYSWTMQTDNLYSINGYKAVNDAFKNMTKVLVYFGESDYNQTSTQASIVDVDGAQEWELSGFGEQGYAYITALDVTASAGENATFSATFTGTGTLEEVTTAVPHDILMLYVGGTDVTASQLETNIESDKSTASSGDEVTINPTDVTDKRYYAPYISCTSNNGTPQWDMTNKYWKLTMPDDNVTITLSDTTKYSALFTGNSEPANYKGVYDEDRSYFPVNSYVHVVPINTEIDDNSYICQVTYIANNSTVSITPSWNSSYNYWEFIMPAYEVTSYIYHQ